MTTLDQESLRPLPPSPDSSSGLVPLEPPVGEGVLPLLPVEPASPDVVPLVPPVWPPPPVPAPPKDQKPNGKKPANESLKKKRKKEGAGT